MATAYVNQERFGVEFEDRVNRLVNTDPEETPLLSMIAKRECYNNQVDWQQESLDTPNPTNSGVQGADVTNAASDYTSPVGLLNYTQMPQRPFGSDFSSNRIKKPGIGDGAMSMFNHEKAKKLKVLKLDMEAAMLSNGDRRQPLPESTQSGLIRGMQRWIQTNSIDMSTAANKTKYGGSVLSLPIFEALAKQTVDSGGTPETVMANSTNRLRINAFAGDLSRDVDSLGRKIMRMIDQIVSIAGMQNVVFNRRLDQSVLLMLEMKYWEMGWLREPQSYVKGLSGSRTDGWVEAEFTLISYAEKTSGKITGLTTGV